MEFVVSLLNLICATVVLVAAYQTYVADKANNIVLENKWLKICVGALVALVVLFILF